MKYEPISPQMEVLLSRQPYTLCQSGQGGGKSTCIPHLLALFSQYCTDAIGMVAANTYGQLSDSTLMETFKVWKADYGWTEWSPENKSGYYVQDVKPPKCFKDHGYTFKTNNNKIFLRNGHVIMTASLDNYKSLDGRTVGYMCLDETKDTKREAVTDVLMGRLRQKKICLTKDKRYGYENFNYVDPEHEQAGMVQNPLFIFSSPTKEQWLSDFFDLYDLKNEIENKIFSKTEYFSTVHNKNKIVVYSSYLNEHNLPPRYIPNRIEKYSSDKVDLLVYSSPFGKSGAEYYIDFDLDKHVRNVTYIPGYPLHLCWDFNVRPYISLSVWQVIDIDGGYQVRGIDEFAMKPPNNYISDACDSFLAKYREECKYGVFYYGDASGNNRELFREAKTKYDKIHQSLRGVVGNRSKRILKYNPRHRTVSKGTLGRRDFMNGILKGHYDVQVYIDKDMKYTRNDFMYCKEDANGAKQKKIEQIDGVRCQKYGHMSDAADGMFCYLFGNYKKR